MLELMAEVVTALNRLPLLENLPRAFFVGLAHQQCKPNGRKLRAGWLSWLWTDPLGDGNVVGWQRKLGSLFSRFRQPPTLPCPSSPSTDSPSTSMLRLV